MAGKPLRARHVSAHDIDSVLAATMGAVGQSFALFGKALGTGDRHTFRYASRKRVDIPCLAV